MGTIGSVNGYYQLANLLSSGSGSSSSLTSGASASSSLAQLEQELGISSSSGSGSYLLDLSPTAQALMNGGSSASGSSTKFTLTSAQQTQIEGILEKYKGQPMTQATFQEIQNALSAAGLSPEQLGAEDQITSFNATGILMDDLSGNYSSISTPSTDESNEQTKENSYMQSVAALWKSLDTSSADGTSTGGTASSASGASL